MDSPPVGLGDVFTEEGACGISAAVVGTGAAEGICGAWLIDGALVTGAPGVPVDAGVSCILVDAGTSCVLVDAGTSCIPVDAAVIAAGYHDEGTSAAAAGVACTTGSGCKSLLVLPASSREASGPVSVSSVAVEPGLLIAVSCRSSQKASAPSRGRSSAARRNARNRGRRKRLPLALWCGIAGCFP